MGGWVGGWVWGVGGWMGGWVGGFEGTCVYKGQLLTHSSLDKYEVSHCWIS